MPEAPAPITASLLGSSPTSHAPAVSTTRSPKRRSSTGFATEPVASTTLSVSSSRPSNCPPTTTLASPFNEPWPSTTSTSFFFISPPTPLVSVLTTLSRCLRDPGEVHRRALDLHPEALGVL